MASFYLRILIKQHKLMQSHRRTMRHGGQKPGKRTFFADHS